MKWKNLTIYLWPVLAWPLTHLVWVSISGLYGRNFSYTFLTDTFLQGRNWPYITIIFLLIFALSIYLWLCQPSWKTFIGTILTSGVLLNWPGEFLAWVLYGISTGIEVHKPDPNDPFPTGPLPWDITQMIRDLPMSYRIAIVAVIIAIPYILILVRNLIPPKEHEQLP